MELPRAQKFEEGDFKKMRTLPFVLTLAAAVVLASGNLSAQQTTEPEPVVVRVSPSTIVSLPGTSSTATITVSSRVWDLSGLKNNDVIIKQASDDAVVDLKPQVECPSKSKCEVKLTFGPNDENQYYFDLYGQGKSGSFKTVAWTSNIEGRVGKLEKKSDVDALAGRVASLEQEKVALNETVKVLTASNKDLRETVDKLITEQKTAANAVKASEDKLAAVEGRLVKVENFTAAATDTIGAHDRRLGTAEQNIQVIAGVVGRSMQTDLSYGSQKSGFIKKRTRFSTEVLDRMSQDRQRMTNIAAGKPADEGVQVAQSQQ